LTEGPRPSLWCFVALAFLGACDPTPPDGERVRIAVEEVRARPSSDIAGRRAATEKLAALEVTDARARTARDACARAYQMSSSLFEGLGELAGRSRSGQLDATDAAELARLDALQRDAATELETCTKSLASLD
jgi:hypothetical protein